MKKLIQISLIAILVLTLFQVVVGGSATASDQANLGIATNISSVTNTVAEEAQMATCLVHVKGIPCVRPNVGWNS